MRTFLIGATLVTTLAYFPASASAQCCADHSRHATPAAPAACCQMDCCNDNEPAVAAAGFGLVGETPAVQTLRVTFRDPVRVGHVLLMGQYVIEHDDARMARGEPCTHIYEAADRRLPVVTFHCTHLTRATANQPTVVLRRGPDMIQVLAAFQYAGDEDSHGVPTIR